MSDNLVLINTECRAKCVHCPYADSSPHMKFPIDPLSSVAYARDDFVILSGGEPFEAKFSVLDKYIRTCVSAGKYFRIATGGHVPLERFLPYLSEIPGFGGIQLGTDVLLPERNAFSEFYSITWKKNLYLLSRLPAGFGLTMTVSKGVNFNRVVNQLDEIKPNFFLINSLNRSTNEMSTLLELLGRRYPEVKIETGYTG